MTLYRRIHGQNVPYTAEEEEARVAEEARGKLLHEGDDIEGALQALRNKRNNLIAETDFYALSDVTMSDDMTTYRQALRDMPAGKDTVKKVNDATWPTKP